jgi:Lon protease-like protein
MPMNAVYRGPADLAEIISVFPLAGALLLPRGQLPLNIFEPRYLAMVDHVLRDGPPIQVRLPSPTSTASAALAA